MTQPACAPLTHSSILHSSPPDPRGGQAAKSPAAHSADNLSNFSAVCTVYRLPSKPTHFTSPTSPTPDCEPWSTICFSEGRSQGRVHRSFKKNAYEDCRCILIIACETKDTFLVLNSHFEKMHALPMSLQLFERHLFYLGC